MEDHTGVLQFDATKTEQRKLPVWTPPPPTRQTTDTETEAPSVGPDRTYVEHHHSTASSAMTRTRISQSWKLSTSGKLEG